MLGPSYGHISNLHVLSIMNEIYKFGIWPQDGHNIVKVDRRCDGSEYLEGLDHETDGDKI